MFTLTQADWAPIKPQQLHKSLCSGSFSILFLILFLFTFFAYHTWVHWNIRVWILRLFVDLGIKKEQNLCNRNGSRMYVYVCICIVYVYRFGFYSSEHCPGVKECYYIILNRCIERTNERKNERFRMYSLFVAFFVHWFFFNRHFLYFFPRRNAFCWFSNF